MQTLEKPDGMLVKFFTSFACWIIQVNVRVFIFLKKDLNHLQIAQLICNFLNSSFLLKTLHPYLNNPYQHSLLEFIFFYVTKNLNFSPDVSTCSDSLTPLITSEDLPAVILSTHTGFAFVTRHVSSIKKNFYIVSTVSDGKSLRDRFKRSGVTQKVNVILNDKYCLANIKEQLAQNATIICCVDYKPVGSKNYTLISPNIFKFVHLLNLPVFFHKDEILSNGHVRINFFQANPSLDANLLAQQFIDYINESRQFKKLFALSAKEK